MIILDASNRSVRVVLAGMVATNQLPVVVSYVDITSSSYAPGSSNTQTNGTTPVTAVAAPSSGVRRQVKLITIFNNDTASATVTVEYRDGATSREMCKVALEVGATLVYTDGEGWRTLLSNGSISSAATVSDNIKKERIDFVIREYSQVGIQTGVAGYLRVPFAGTITGVRLFGDTTGSIVVDIWKDTYANFPPTVADSITASAPPTLSSAQKSEDTTLTGWTKSLAEGDILGFNVNSVTDLRQVTLSLSVTRV